MNSFSWALFLGCVCFQVTHTEASQWTVKVPSTVKGLPGSCVVIPCSFNYPNPSSTGITGFTGMWIEDSHQLICHPDKSKVMQQFRGRTELLGDASQKSCSLKIDPLQPSDRGPFYFRIELTDYEKYSYRDNLVSISMITELSPIHITVEDKIVEGENVSASCSVSHYCPASPPVFTWSHLGRESVQSEQLDVSQWKATSTLTFQPSIADHNKPLQCTVTYKGGQHQKTSRVLKVEHAPVNVKVEHRSDVKEGEAVRLRCSSDAYPAASSYQWHSETGALLHPGNTYMLQNVSRHTAAVYCTAINTAGRGKSNLVRLNVLYAPEIKIASSCSSEAEMMKCVCIAESKPPCMVQFVLSDRVLPSTRVEKHGSVTIGTLQAQFGSSVVVCLANNTLGTSNLTLSLPANSKMQNLSIVIASGVGGILVMVVITVMVVKKCRRRPEAAPAPDVSTMKADKDVVLSQYAATKRKERSYDDVHCSDIYANDPVYGNVENDWDDAIYANC